MEEHDGRSSYVGAIEDIVRQITWQSQKQLMQTLARPEMGLTMPQLVTLSTIRSLRICRMSDLAECTHQSAGTLTGIVDRLIDDNLVERVRDIDDRRVVHVRLTREGDDRLQRVEAARRLDMDRMLRNFTGHELAELERMLRLYLNNLQHTTGNATAVHDHLQPSGAAGRRPVETRPTYLTAVSGNSNT
jgi:DNA-binding MarR family transcriptional regulator